jgi:tRNA threonylcarbamoyladenosine biosynthesis protein TsaE
VDAFDQVRSDAAGPGQVGSVSTRSIVTRTEDETMAEGRRLAADLAPGTVVLLEGDLGAGKTAFVRGLAEGLGIDPAEVSSPTFTIVQEYRGPGLTLQHADLYRLAPVEVADLALEDLLDDRTVMAIEWPERLPWPPRATLVHVRLAHHPDGRLVTIQPA